jgi:hypothetical protein
MKRLMLAVTLAAGAGCASQSQIGPYVKSVARNGAWLAVQKCMIVLEGEELLEGPCTIEQVPLMALPAAPAGPGMAVPATQPIRR